MPRLTLLAFAAAVAGLAAVVAPRPAPVAADVAPAGAKVSLAVHVVFDQMRGDYLEKWRPLFRPDGFNRLMTDGAWFADCLYPYAGTSTGPGHSAMLSGATLDLTGIVNNEWYDRRAGAVVYCAGSDRYQLVPGSAAKPAGNKKPGNVGNPDRMLAETVADVLKQATAGRGKVFGLSLKDRSAILPTGKRPDGAYWFTDKFVTSTYYRDASHRWVTAFNEAKSFDRWRGKKWERFRPDLDYAAHSEPDDGRGEGDGTVSEDKRQRQGRTFPHPMVDAKYYESLAYSPFGNELLLEFAKACVRAERLGRRGTPDLLVISFSSNDLIGHTWGPDSQEVLDVTLRSDALMADLLRFLDEQVGPGQYSLTLTADHGVCPLPEWSAAHGTPAARVSHAALVKKAEEHLRAVFGRPANADDKPEALADEKNTAGKPGLWIESAPAPWFYLNYRQLAAANVAPARAAAELARWLPTQPGIEQAFTAAELRTADGTDETRTLARRSFHPDRCGDVMLVLKPYHLLSTTATGTSHGGPHRYDRHVPLLVYGPGVLGGRREEPVTPQHAAAVVAHFLGVERPKQAMYGLPETLLK